MGEVIYNPFGHPLTSSEVQEVLPGCDGYIAGLDAIDRAALEAADGAEIAGKAERGEDIVVALPTGKIILTGEDLLIETSASEGFACAEDGGYLAELDTTLNDELVDEGAARIPPF